MPSKVSKNKKPLEIEKIEEPDNKMNKQQQREKLKLELALLNSDSEIEEESPVIERVKNIKQKDSEVKDSPSDTQSYTQTKAKERENRETERTISKSIRSQKIKR